MEMFLPIAISLFVFYVLWRIMQPAWQVRIVSVAGKVQFVRGVAVAKRAEIESFLNRDIAHPGRLEVLARRERSGQLTLYVKGNLDQGVKQQIRNFLVSQL